MNPLAYLIKTRVKSPIEKEIRILGITMSKIFPELTGETLTIHNTNSSHHVASYEWHRGIIEVNFNFFENDRDNTLPFVLAHETTHAVQWKKRTIPLGERSCDIFTLARLPTNLYPKKKAFYVKIQKKVLLTDPERIQKTAKRAIELREMGMRKYIFWFENEIKS